MNSQKGTLIAKFSIPELAPDNLETLMSWGGALMT